MNDDIDHRRVGSFDKSLSESDEQSDDETVEKDYLTAKSEPEEKEKTESDVEREEEEQMVKKNISSSRSNPKQVPSQKELSDYSNK